MRRVKNARKNSKTCSFSNQIEIKGGPHIVELPQFVCKYLEYLDYQVGLSNHSIRAYGTDVLQLFQLEKQFFVSGPKIDGNSDYCLKKTTSPIMSKSCDEWGQRALNKLRKWDNLSVKSRKRKISSLKGFLSWLKNYQGIEIIVAVEAPSGQHRKLPHFLSLDECIGLLKHLDKDKLTAKEQQQKSLFLLMYGCGLRVSEACQIKWSDISLTQKTLRITGKGGKERLAILPKGVAHYIAKLNKNGDYLWGDKKLPTRTAYQSIRDLGKAAGLLKPIHPHALRHSYATHLLSSGSDLRVLQQLLGHQSLAATELYTHLDMDQLANTMESHHPLSKK